LRPQAGRTRETPAPEHSAAPEDEPDLARTT
jgi:hypothetical protein